MLGAWLVRIWFFGNTSKYEALITKYEATGTKYRVPSPITVLTLRNLRILWFNSLTFNFRQLP